jgi:hypothetical protein
MHFFAPLNCELRLIKIRVKMRENLKKEGSIACIPSHKIASSNTKKKNKKKKLLIANFSLSETR